MKINLNIIEDNQFHTSCDVCGRSGVLLEYINGGLCVCMDCIAETEIDNEIEKAITY